MKNLLVIFVLALCAFGFFACNNQQYIAPTVKPVINVSPPTPLDSIKIWLNNAILVACKTNPLLCLGGGRDTTIIHHGDTIVVNLPPAITKDTLCKWLPRLCDAQPTQKWITTKVRFFSPKPFALSNNVITGQPNDIRNVDALGARIVTWYKGLSSPVKFSLRGFLIEGGSPHVINSIFTPDDTVSRGVIEFAGQESDVQKLSNRLPEALYMDKSRQGTILWGDHVRLNLPNEEGDYGTKFATEILPLTGQVSRRFDVRWDNFGNSGFSNNLAIGIAEEVYQNFPDGLKTQLEGVYVMELYITVREQLYLQMLQK